MPQPITQNVLILTTNVFDTLNTSNVSVTPTPVTTLPKENLQKEDSASKMRVLSDNAIISLTFDDDTFSQAIAAMAASSVEVNKYRYQII